VQSGTVGLEHGREVRGVEILTVIPGSPGGAAGLQGSSPGIFRTTTLFIGMVAGAALFPPAMLALMASANRTRRSSRWMESALVTSSTLKKRSKRPRLARLRT